MSPPVPKRNVDAADRFHSAAIHALRHVRREDPATGLSAARLSALSVLVFGGPRTLGELAADPADGRVVRLQATPEGERVLWQARRRRVASLAGLLTKLEAEEVERV